MQQDNAETQVEILELTRETLDAMLTHAAAEAPRECCGLLTGTSLDQPPGRITRIDSAVATENLEPGTTRFLVNPAQHFALLKELRGTSHAIVGAYHSHPASAPAPSESDVAGASGDMVHLIVSLADPSSPTLEAFRVVDGTARSVRVVTREEAEPPRGGRSVSENGEHAQDPGL